MRSRNESEVSLFLIVCVSEDISVIVISKEPRVVTSHAHQIHIIYLKTREDKGVTRKQGLFSRVTDKFLGRSDGNFYIQEIHYQAMFRNVKGGMG